MCGIQCRRKAREQMEMQLQWAAKELAIANAVKYASSGGLEISHVQPSPTQLVLGMLKPIASGILL